MNSEAIELFTKIIKESDRDLEIIIEKMKELIQSSAE